VAFLSVMVVGGWVGLALMEMWTPAVPHADPYGAKAETTEETP
jgi:hypothetical protein